MQGGTPVGRGGAVSLTVQTVRPPRKISLYDTHEGRRERTRGRLEGPHEARVDSNLQPLTLYTHVYASMSKVAFIRKYHFPFGL